MNDLISRSKAIRWVKAECNPYGHPTLDYESGIKVIEHLERLPSAQPERTGKWIKLDAHAHLADHKCSACGQECYVPTCMGDPMYDFCPNCGADMRGEQDG